MATNPKDFVDDYRYNIQQRLGNSMHNVQHVDDNATGRYGFSFAYNNDHDECYMIYNTNTQNIEYNLPDINGVRVVGNVSAKIEDGFNLNTATDYFEYIISHHQQPQQPQQNLNHSHSHEDLHHNYSLT